MESEMSAERIAGNMVAAYFGDTGEGVRLSVDIAQTIREAEGRGYQRGQAEQSAPCDREDLKGLEGRELRDRIKSRAHTWKCVVADLQRQVRGNRYKSDMLDLQILIDLIQSKSQACEVEADRLWSEYLDTFEPLLDEQDGAAKIVAALGQPYLSVIVDRRAARRARDEGLYIPTIEELAMQVQQEAS